MSTTSVSLESLQYLLPHMDANRRFEISKRCPALRANEKSVSLKIDSLTFMESCVTVNGTRYRIGIIRKYNDGEAPDFVKARNEQGGVPYEVDRYGIRDWLDGYTVTPGDVGIELLEEPYIEDEDLDITRYENQIGQYEEQLAQLRERRPNRNQRIVDQLEKNIEIARANLFEYQCRRENIPPNFEHFLQLTKSRTVNNQEQKSIERYAHNKKHSEAMKQMTTTLFGGRSSPIHVTKFTFICSMGVIRLPIGLQFHIEQLIFRDVESNLEALAPILHESSFPLKKLDTTLLTVNDATNPIVAASGVLSVRMILRDNLQTIRAITNPVARISIMRLPDETIEGLIGIWLESQRPIGTNYTFYFHREPFLVDEIEDILKKLNGVFIDDENVIIPMSDSTQLKVSHGTFPEFAPRSKWAARFLTEAIQH